MFPRRLAALCALSFALLAPNAFAQAALTSDPPNFDFGSRVAFTQSPPKAFVITNAGPNDEAFHAILTEDLTRTGHLPFVPDLAGSTCLSGAVVHPSESCTVEYRFTPDAAQAFSARFQLADANGLVPLQVGMTGVGLGLDVAPTAFNFAQQPLSTLSGAQVFTGTAVVPVQPDSSRTTGPDLDDFLVTNDSCTGAQLATGDTCQVHVRFAPSAQSARSAALEIVDGGVPTGIAALTGTGGPLPQGPQGPEGDDGANGAQGPIGGAGDRGPAGADGATGATGATGASGPATAASSRRSAPVALLTRRARLAGDSIALRLRCPAGSGLSMGTVTLRSTTAIRGARRTLGTTSFGCAAGTTRTVHVGVRLNIRRMLRRHHHAATLMASTITRGDGTATQLFSRLTLGAARR